MSIITRVPESRRVVAKQPVKESKSGLCSTCLNAPSCCYTNSKGEPILFCEEFEGFLPSTVEETNPVKSPKEEAESTSAIPSEQGLCFNCSKKEECTYRSSGKGTVWHCEEYE